LIHQAGADQQDHRHGDVGGDEEPARE